MTVPICVKCRWSAIADNTHQCFHALAPLDVVTGDRKVPCVQARDSHWQFPRPDGSMQTLCGEDGRLFEALGSV